MPADPIESRLLRMHAEGTQGEWTADPCGGVDAGDEPVMNCSPKNAALIATSRNSIEALCRVVAAARLPRNTRWTDIVEPGWVAVPVDDFDRLRAAIRALDEKGGAA